MQKCGAVDLAAAAAEIRSALSSVSLAWPSGAKLSTLTGVMAQEDRML